ncbi:MAG: Eco57I restriction-modification methylase domain-containing protein [Eubacteriales bacterium]
MQIHKDVLKDIEKLYDTLPSKMNEEVKIRFVIKSVLLKYLIDNRYIEQSQSLPINICINFTINEIIRTWYGEYCNYLQEETLTLDTLTVNHLKKYINVGHSLLGLNSDVLGSVYEYMSNVYFKKQKGMFYTPKKIIQHMISLMDIQWNTSFTLIDPACGSGFFLSEIYDTIKEQVQKNSYISEEDLHNQAIKNQLYGIESDYLGGLITKLVLNLKSKKFVPIQHIYCEDALFITLEKTFDYVMGNPPYIGHKLLRSGYMMRLKEAYADVFYDKGDISYCFFKKGYQLLKENGKLLYITSRYFIESLNAQGLRGFLKDHFYIDLVIDFNGNRVIKGAKVDLVIIKTTKKHVNNKSIQVYKLQKDLKIDRYHDIFSNVGDILSYSYFKIDQSQLQGKGWVLIDRDSRKIIDKISKRCNLSLANICSSNQGIITGYDKAFIIGEDETSYYQKNLIKPWVKNTDVQKFNIHTKGKYLLYTNDVEDIKKDPCLYRHLLPFKDKLQKRRECEKGTREWYQLQWGRNKENFENKKIIFPYKACQNRFAIDEQGYYFSADIYSLVLQENLFNYYTYEFLVCLLNSTLYEFYFKSFAKKLGGSMYEYYPNTLMRLRIPDIDEQIMHQFTIYHDNIVEMTKNGSLRDITIMKYKIDCFFYDFFRLSDIERHKVEGTLNKIKE